MEIEEVKETPSKNLKNNRGSDITEFEIGFITALRIIPKPFPGTEIQKFLKEAGYDRAYETVKRNIAKLKLGENLETIHKTRVNCGRKSKIGEETSKKFIELIEENRELSGTDLSHTEINHKNVSRITINELLNKNGFIARIKPNKPTISEINKEKRLKFALNHEKGTLLDGGKIMFSDESAIYSGKGGKNFVRIKNGENIYNEKFIEKKERQIKKKISVGGCICYDGSVSLVWLHKNLDSDLYLTEILEKEVSTFQYLESQGIFQQDNARPHTTQKIRDGFTEKKINCLEWPPQSPDLSPIENIWSFIKDFLNDHKKELTNNEAIGNLTQQCGFSNDLSNLIKKCYESLPNRIKEVIQNNGGPTCY